MKFAHIINPVAVPPSSDLHRAQPVTFASMQAATRFAAAHDIEVELLATGYAEDRDVAPSTFRQTALLQRSVLDCASFQRPRKLPLIADILDRAYTASDADYLIYSNVDIALLPHFYTSVAALIEDGDDALVINRRTIGDNYEGPEQLMRMYAEAGQPHPGYDCFIFQRQLQPRLELRQVCIGATAIGLVMTANLIKLASQFGLYEDLHLSFHLGDDRDWQNPQLDDYRQHNEAQAAAILEQLERRHQAFSADDPGWCYAYLQQIRQASQPPVAEPPVQPTQPAQTPIPEPTPPPAPAVVEAAAFQPPASLLAAVEQARQQLKPDRDELIDSYRQFANSQGPRIAADIELVERFSNPDSRVLEYLSGPPLLAATLQQRGYQPVLLETMSCGFEQTLADQGLELRHSDIENQPLPLASDQFDLIVCAGLLSQLHVNPLFTLGEALRVLKPGGMLMLSSANARSLSALNQLLRHQRSGSIQHDIVDEYQRLTEPGQHAHRRDYSADEAQRLLQHSGFTVERIIFRGGFRHAAANLLLRLLPGFRPQFTLLASKPRALT